MSLEKHPQNVIEARVDHDNCSNDQDGDAIDLDVEVHAVLPAKGNGHSADQSREFMVRCHQASPVLGREFERMFPFEFSSRIVDANGEISAQRAFSKNRESGGVRPESW